MKNRSPYNLKNVLIMYNIMMISVNLFIIIEVKKGLLIVFYWYRYHYDYVEIYLIFFFQLLMMAIKLNYNWMCQPITYVNLEAELRVNFDHVVI